MSASSIWSFTLDNGYPSQAGLIEAQANSEALLLSPSDLDAVIETPYTAAQLFRLLAAVAAGKTRITNQGTGHEHVEFDSVDGAATRVAADMTDCERTVVVVTP
jgi:hypothetical protein